MFFPGLPVSPRVCSWWFKLIFQKFFLLSPPLRGFSPSVGILALGECVWESLEYVDLVGIAKECLQQKDISMRFWCIFVLKFALNCRIALWNRKYIGRLPIPNPLRIRRDRHQRSRRIRCCSVCCDGKRSGLHAWLSE